MLHRKCKALPRLTLSYGSILTTSYFEGFKAMGYLFTSLAGGFVLSLIKIPHACEKIANHSD